MISSVAHRTGSIGVALLSAVVSVGAVASATDGLEPAADVIPLAGPGLEPNDTFDQALDLGGCPVVLSVEIGAEGDVDFFMVRNQAGRTVTLEVFAERIGSALDSLLAAFDSGGRRLALSDDDPGPDDPLTRDSYLAVEVPLDGELVFAVTSARDRDFDGRGDHLTAGSYQLIMNCITEVCGDGNVLGLETCDPPGQPASQPSACRNDCRFCGDGRLDVGPEQCDDRNNASDDGCSASCLFEGCDEVVVELLSLVRLGVTGTAYCRGGFSGTALELVDTLPDPPPNDAYSYYRNNRCTNGSRCRLQDCFGSAVSLSDPVLACNSQLTISVQECEDASDPLPSLGLVQAGARLTVEVLSSGGGFVVDTESPFDLGLTQPVASVPWFVIRDVAVTDGTGYDAGNGVLDVRPGDRIRVTYADEANGLPDPAKRRVATAVATCP